MRLICQKEVIVNSKLIIGQNAITRKYFLPKMRSSCCIANVDTVIANYGLVINMEVIFNFSS